MRRGSDYQVYLQCFLPPDHGPALKHKVCVWTFTRSTCSQCNIQRVQLLSRGFLSFLFTNYCKSPESQYHDRKGGKMPFQPNVVILKGRATERCLPQTMVHIFSQWGSLMCEQGSGKAVNRAFYEAARGELGCQWRGLSHVCHVSTLGPGLFVLMAAQDWRDCWALFTLYMCQAGEFPLDGKLTSRVASESHSCSPSGIRFIAPRRPFVSRRGDTWTRLTKSCRFRMPKKIRATWNLFESGAHFKDATEFWLFSQNFDFN